jgi:hypothetical protein
MDSKPIYVAKPPPVYTAPLWDFERGGPSPLLPSMCLEGSRTVEESLPVPPKPCIYGSIGDGRPNPSIRARRCRWTVSLSQPPSKGTPIIPPEDADYGAVEDERPKTPAEHFASYIRSLIPDAEISTRPSLQPGDLIYLTTPRGPRYYYERRLVTDNLVNYIPNVQSRRERSRTYSNSNESQSELIISSSSRPPLYGNARKAAPDTAELFPYT